MKYKVGDKVRIREDLVEEEDYGGAIIVDDMVNMSGDVVTIESVVQISDKGFIYHIVEDSDKYDWTSAMFEPV